MTDYIKNIQQAMNISRGNSDIYEGEAGALRLAREIGSCLRDSDEKETDI